MIAQSFIMFTFLISLATAWQSSSTCDISKATVQRSPSTNSYDGTACNNIKETLLSHHHSIFFDSVPPSDIFINLKANRTIVTPGSNCFFSFDQDATLSIQGVIELIDLATTQRAYEGTVPCGQNNEPAQITQAQWRIGVATQAEDVGRTPQADMVRRDSDSGRSGYNGTSLGHRTEAAWGLMAVMVIVGSLGMTWW